MAVLARLLLGIGLAAASAVLAIWRPTPLAALDLRVFDALVRADTRVSAPAHTAVITIDEVSMARFGQWPWPRDIMATLVERLHQNGATAVALDVLFAETERHTGDGDARLAQALARHPSVVGHTIVFDPNATAEGCVLHPLALVERQRGAWPPSDGVLHGSGAICTLPALSRAAGASGFINVAADPDGLLRRVPLLLRLGNDIYPGLALAAARRATGSGPVVLDARADGSITLTIGTRSVVLDARGRLLVHRSGPWPHISAVDVIEGRVPSSAVEGRVAFVGATAAGLRDLTATARDTAVPGVEIHAALAETLLGAAGYAPPEWAALAEVAAAVIVSLLLAIIATRRGLLAATIAAALLGWLLWWSAGALLRTGTVVSPTWALAAAVITLAGEGIARLDRERRRADRERRHRENAQRLIVQALTTLTETRDVATGLHARRTQEYTRLLATALARRAPFRRELSDDRVVLLATLAPLHDIGKVGVADAVLRKPGLLTPEEQAEMRRHPDLGYDSLLRAEELAGVHDDEVMALAKEIVRTHHERWDGSGYPRGLRASDIPLSGRIVAVVDTYDAMVSGRTYQDALPHEEAVALITQRRGTHFDPEIVDAFLDVADTFRTVEPHTGAPPNA